MQAEMHQKAPRELVNTVSWPAHLWCQLLQRGQQTSAFLGPENSLVQHPVSNKLFHATWGAFLVQHLELGLALVEVTPIAMLQAGPGVSLIDLHR